MREILFRGKRVDNGEWIYGYYIKATHHWHNHGIHEDWIATDTVQNGGWCNVRGKYAVIPETVGQYTGLTDKTGKKIFENDIVSHFINYLGQRVHASVEYDNELAIWMCNYTFENKKGSDFLCDWVDGNGAEIIGNEWDNPELLKGGETDA